MGPFTNLFGRQASKKNHGNQVVFGSKECLGQQRRGAGHRVNRVVWQTLDDRDNDVMTCRYLRLQTIYLSGAYLHLVDMSNLRSHRNMICLYNDYSNMTVYTMSQSNVMHVFAVM